MVSYDETGDLYPAVFSHIEYDPEVVVVTNSESKYPRFRKLNAKEKGNENN